MSGFEVFERRRYWPSHTSEPRPRGAHTATEVCAASGVTYRQLDYWDRTNLIQPSVAPARGSGSARLYSDADVGLLLAAKAMLDDGRTLRYVRDRAAALRAEKAEA